MEEFFARTALVICVAAGAYLSGCVNGAIVTSQVFYHTDIRKHGSGNAGLTNFYRTFGGRHALLVIAIDMLKAVAAIGIGSAVFSRYLGDAVVGKFFSAWMCVLGHIFPAFYGFKGGKGIMCSGTLLLLLDWRIALVGWGLFALLWGTTRYVSLGSVTAAVSLPITAALVFRGKPLAIVLALCISLTVLWAHRENIVRLVRGEERRFEWHK